MALITLFGEPGCRTEEVARIVAQRLGWDLVTNARLQSLRGGEFVTSAVSEKIYPQVVLSVLARLASEHHLVTTASGAEVITPRDFPALLRVHVIASESWRTGTIMLDKRLERPAARRLLAELDGTDRGIRKQRFGRSLVRPHDMDLILNAGTLESDGVASAIVAAAEARRLPESGYLSAASEAQIQFRVRLELAKHGISPPDRPRLKRPVFVHPSEKIFANLLDFYRIAWEYEPKSFPIQWDKNGKVTEAFTPDFYLPEFDLYLELTTMKQAHVTKKNRKIKLVKQLYPDINVQVFYQKDFENLIFKHGLSERLSSAEAVDV